MSAAWGHTPPFTTFDEIQILDAQPPPTIGHAPPAYLDFMAYREDALGVFLRQIAARIHAASGIAIVQFGSVWDVLSSSRGTLGFGHQIAGYDRLIVDDAPEYDHDYSMDYTRTNTPGVTFGNEADAPCRFGCTTTPDQCCDAQTYPAYNDIPSGIAALDAQVSQTYARGASWVDFANWDNFYTKAFGLFSSSIANAVALANGAVTTVVAADTQRVSLRALYVKHHDSAYIDSLVSAHAALGGSSQPIAVVLDYDLSPPVPLAVSRAALVAGIQLAPPRPNPARAIARFRFTLPARTAATLRLFDAAGRAVATLADGVLDAGPHDATLDTRRLAVGVYWCRLEASGETRTREIQVAR